MADYLPLVVLGTLGVLFGAVSFPINKLLAPRQDTKAKTGPYECGIQPSKEPPERFPVKFYLVAMLFIMFDIEIIFLYPWATQHESLGVFGFGAIVLFSFVLFASYIYEVSKGGLEWGPRVRSDRLESDPATSGMVSSSRTTRTTIRRVGLEGRPLDEVA